MRTKPRVRYPTQKEVEAGERRFNKRLATEPLAEAVKYDAGADAVHVWLNNGAILTVPRCLMQGLQDASQAELQVAEVGSWGFWINFPKLDAQFSVMGLLSGMFGGRRWMSELARRAGSVKSPAKAAASRLNGRKGGRPRKQPASSRS